MLGLAKMESLPSGFEYPKDYIVFLERDFKDILPWFVLQEDEIGRLRDGLSNRYPYRNLVPFARRRDREDVACFDIEKGNGIVIIHDYAGAGWEFVCEYSGIWNWFGQVAEDIIDYENN
ncbi:MAG: hypothetical protein KF744_15045 [Taibaiella sp.]|nr:hypothetical protein [Taibaiella sp.]